MITGLKKITISPTQISFVLYSFYIKYTVGVKCVVIKDKTKAWGEIADALVQVTGSYDPDAFKTMMSGNKTGFARVGNNKLCYCIMKDFRNKA